MTPPKKPTDLQTVGTATAIIVALASLWSNYADPVEAQLSALETQLSDLDTRLVKVECKLSMEACK